MQCFQRRTEQNECIHFSFIKTNARGVAYDCLPDWYDGWNKGGKMPQTAYLSRYHGHNLALSNADVRDTPGEITEGGEDQESRGTETRMAPKRSGGGRGGRGGQGGTAPTRRSKRNREDATFEPMREDPERLIRDARRARAQGRTRGTARERGGHRETGGLRRPRTSHAAEDGAERNSPASVPAPADSQAATDPPSGQPDPANEPSKGAEVDNANSSQEQAPTGSAQATGKGSGDEGENNKGANSGDGSEKSPGKRSNEDDEEGENDPKRPKTGNEEGQVSPTTTKDPTPPSLGPCEAFLAMLSLWQDDARGDTALLEDPAVRGENLELGTLFRAIAAVTEAVAASGGPVFSLVDPNHTGFTTAQNVARPRNDVLYPYALGGRATTAARTSGGHLALFIYRTATSDNRSFAVDNYDSSGSRLGGARREQIAEAYEETRRLLLSSMWLENETLETVSAPDTPTNQPAPTQRSNWVCGLHVIFSAWTYALGLAQANGGIFTPEFYHRGVQVVNLAMQGRMDSLTIRNFLACYGFIQQDSEVPIDRVFGDTISFRTNDELTEYIARTRLEDNLRVLRGGDPAMPSLQLALDVIREAGIPLPDNDLVNWDAVRIHEEYIRAQDIAQEAVTGPHNESHPERNVDDSETTQQTPGTAGLGETLGQGSGNTERDRQTTTTQRPDMAHDSFRRLLETPISLGLRSAITNLRNSFTRSDAMRQESGVDRDSDSSETAQQAAARPDGTGGRNPGNTQRDTETTNTQGSDITERIRSFLENHDPPPEARAQLIDLHNSIVRLQSGLDGNETTQRESNATPAGTHDGYQDYQQPDNLPPESELPRSTLLASSLLEILPNNLSLPNEQQVREYYAGLPGLIGARLRGLDNGPTPPINALSAPERSRPRRDSRERPRPGRRDSREELRPHGLPIAPILLLPGLGRGMRDGAQRDESGEHEQRERVTARDDNAESGRFSPMEDHLSQPPDDPAVHNDGTQGADGEDPLPDYEYYEELDAELFGDNS